MINIYSVDELKLMIGIKSSFLTFNTYICTEEVLEYYIDNYDKVDWYGISRYQILSEAFIDKYSDKVDWWDISKYQTLSETFIIKYIDKMDWWNISKFQTLSENIIEKYNDKVDWLCISKYQTLSERFIETHIDKLHLISLFKNNKANLTYTIATKYIYNFNLYDMYKQLINTIHKPIFNRLIEEFPDKYRLDKIAYEFNNNN